MKRYSIKTVDGYVEVVEASTESKAMIIAAERMGRLPIDPLKNYVVYSNIDRECKCRVCELRIDCIHADCFRRLPREFGGLGACQKLTT